MNLYEDARFTPNEEMKKIYDQKRREQNILSFIPVILLLPSMIIYGFMGWLDFFVMLGGHMFTSAINNLLCAGILDSFVFAAIGLFWRSDKPKTVYITMVVMTLYTALTMPYVNREMMRGGLLLIMLAYVILFGIKISNVIKDLNFMRDLPAFPFEHKHDTANLDGMTRKQMAEYLEHMSDGGTYTVKGEEVFTAERPEEVVDPPEKTEEYKQQHKIFWGK